MYVAAAATPPTTGTSAIASNYWTSPAIRLAGAQALAQARLAIDEIDYFDLYSCFPCAVQIGADMLGIPIDDPRPLTVTGGLPYHGGPGNNYSHPRDRLHGRAPARRRPAAAAWSPASAGT